MEDNITYHNDVEVVNMLTKENKKLPIDDIIRRPEYEQFVKLYELRHSELMISVKELEVENKQTVTDILNRMEKMSQEIADIKIAVSRRSLDIWKLAATSAVSVIISYIAFTIQHVIFH